LLEVQYYESAGKDI